MLSDKKMKQILIPIALIVVIFSVVKSINSNKKESELKEENNYVVGEIIDHNISGIAENYFVKYEYYVDGKKFHKTEYYADQFRNCHETRDCIGLKFIVFYKKENPEIAFMDFELQEKDLKIRNLKQKEIQKKLYK